MFTLDHRKAIEAVALLLRLSSHKEMDRKRLLALLYLSDRESLSKTGRPIIGGRISALKHGPIHSEIYDLIKGAGQRQQEWSKNFENDDYRIKMRDDGDAVVSSLSRFEVDLLNEVSQRYSGYGTWDLAELTHTPEYDKNYKEGTSTTIPLEDMISAVDRDSDRESIIQDAKEKNFFDRFFQEAP